MPRVTNADLTSLLESVNILNSESTVESLPTRLFNAISNSVTYEIVGFDGWGQAGSFTGKLWYGPTDWIRAEMMEVFGAFASEHPLVGPLIIQKYQGSLKISDMLTKRQFHRTGLFSEFYNEVGISEQLIAGLGVSPELTVSCALCRNRRDFSERDRVVLDMLAPHLTHAFRNAHVIEQLVRERDYVTSIASIGIIVLDREQNLKFANDMAESFLVEYFPERGVQQLPAALKTFLLDECRNIEGREYFEPAGLFRRRKQNAELQIRAVFDLNLEEVRLVLQEKVFPTTDDYLRLGLTSREAEILHWLAEGKTDEVIGELCNISSRTVHKHVEHIMKKLNVETRTAAVRHAFDTLDFVNAKFH